MILILVLKLKLMSFANGTIGYRLSDGKVIKPKNNLKGKNESKFKLNNNKSIDKYKRISEMINEKINISSDSIMKVGFRTMKYNLFIRRNNNLFDSFDVDLSDGITSIKRKKDINIYDWNSIVKEWLNTKDILYGEITTGSPYDLTTTII